MQDAMQGIEHDIQFDQRRSSHAIDHSQDLITCLEAQVFDDGSSKHLGYLECRGKLSTPAPRFAMDANANLHFVLTQLEGGLARRWHSTRSQGHTHAAPLLIHLPRQRRYLGQGGTRLRQPTYNLLQQHCDADTTPPRRVQAILHCDIIIGDNTLHIYSICLC